MQHLGLIRRKRPFRLPAVFWENATGTCGGTARPPLPLLTSSPPKYWRIRVRDTDRTGLIARVGVWVVLIWADVQDRNWPQ